MITDLDRGGTSVGIGSYSYPRGEVLLRSRVAVNVHGKSQVGKGDIFPERQHGFLRPPTNKHLGVLTNGNIGTIVCRGNVISDRLSSLINDIAASSPSRSHGKR